MGKHAYLIEAHKQDYNLSVLLGLLDDPRNDIFIHMDKKNKTFDPYELTSKIHESNIYFTERSSVEWGVQPDKCRINIIKYGN